MEQQGEFESRKLWHHVTNALRVGDVNTATEHKKFVSFMFNPKSACENSSKNPVCFSRLLHILADIMWLV